MLGVGSSLSPLIGRTASFISVESPLASSVIRDTELAKLLLHELICHHLPWSRHIPLPHLGRGVLISAPREGGNDVDQEIVDYFERQHKFKIALSHARNMKERFGAVGSAVRDLEIQVQGKCLKSKSKLPRKKSITVSELSSCLHAYVDRIERLILNTLEKANPELVSDVLQGCVWFSGGVALMPGLSAELESRLKFNVRTVQDPLGV